VPSTFKILGLAQFEARLSLLENELTAGRTVHAALGAAALPIQNEWKRLAPWKSGNYRRSIHTVVTQEGGKPLATIGTDITGQKAGEVGYPEMLEYGTSKMYPRPSMRPAFDRKKDEAVEEFAASIEASLRSFGI